MSIDAKSSANFDYWLVVDTIRIPDAMEIVRQTTPIHYSLQLFSGDKLEHLIEHSPLVLNLGADEAALECLSLKYFDSSSVIFELPQQCDELAFLQHLQAVFLANIGQTPSMLRFYTNAFWQPIYQDLISEDVNTLLGPTNAVTWLIEGVLQRLEKPEINNTLPEQSYVLTSDIFNLWV